MRSTDKVNSTAMWQIKYDSGTRILEVNMTFDPPKSNGEVFRYADVPEAVYRGLRDAESRGRYFNANIRNSYSLIK